jgi:alpha/beta superfamily hydrolase
LWRAVALTSQREGVLLTAPTFCSRSFVSRFFFALAVTANTGCSFTVRQAHFLYTHKQPLPPISATYTQENVELVSEGTTLRGWFLHKPNAKRTIIFFYGNQGSIIDTTGFTEWIGGTVDADVLTFDYRGYGFSEGKATFAGIGADALRIVDYAQTRFPDRPIFIMGYSLGAVISVYAAAHRTIAGLILMAPATSIDDMVRAMRENGPWYYKLVRIKIESALHALPQPIEDIAHVSVPLLIIHGTADDQVPFWMGETMLATAASKTKTLCAIPHADHEKILYSMDMLTCLTHYFSTDGNRTKE